MAQPSSLSSNNPFRRIGAGASAPALASPVPDEADSTSDAPFTLPSSDHFRSQLEALPRPDHPPPATSFQKPKVVKKVRVQSPPPSSPESAGAPDRYSRTGRYDDESSSSLSDDEDEDERSNPFNITNSSPSVDSEKAAGVEGILNTRGSRGPPPNPFQRTLQDLELGKNEDQNTAVSPGARGALDVDAFKRLLLTGQTGMLDTAQASASASQIAHPGYPAGDGASLTDASSVSRQSIFDATHASVQETPRTSHEISEPEVDDDRSGLITGSRPKAQSPPTATLRKKPPPPSSRHGKLIKVELKDKDRPDNRERSSSSLSDQTVTKSPSPPTPLEINKPLPPSPARHHKDDESESIFDREAAGKVPELAEELVTEPLPMPRPPTPPNASHAPSIITTPISPSAKKPPPPPMRRHPHNRSDSKASVLITAPPTNSTAQPEDLDPSVRRSSQDSTRSRSSSVRVSIHAPAPPPPRRPNHATRASTSFTSPSAVSFTNVLSSGSERSPSEAAEFSPIPSAVQARPSSAHAENTIATEAMNSPSTSGHSGVHPKLFPPPPPPARNASIRSKRPTSASSSSEATPKRMSGLSMPPPPPPRQRGSSKGSIDGVPAGGRKTSDSGVRILEGSLAEEPAGGSGTGTPAESGAANDILADLTALQREVDALRGKVEKK
ncbi:hypothetical protein QBC47DRAFT_177790 [Echria macrotheca]|uniref:Uncharacterized protein n=1 Tax=Echria macrotheca TaxID=438768 RepID=A0AAJ0BJX9_9PEZI|nr:hypothetical protein QBC47DRAFT_177790 [Echria macrotheca]